jgi:CHAD domain-containing protein
MALDADGVQRNLRKLRKLLEKAPRRPSPEKVHDLRTHTRRLEATVGALGLDARRNERRLLRGLGRLRKRAGKVRDMDVLTGYTAAARVDDEQDCRVELLEHLGAERYRHARLLRTLLRRDGAVLRMRLKRTSRRIEKIFPADGGSGSDVQPIVPKEAMATALKLSGELAAPTVLTRKTLHPYRLKVKELRNVLQMATDADRNDFVVRLGEIKDAIGEWHDWETLIAIATQLLAPCTRCRLLREFRAISRRKYERALSLTTGMRKDYLRPPGRGQTEPSVARRATTPALEATAAIAS